MMGYGLVLGVSQASMFVLINVVVVINAMIMHHAIFSQFAKWRNAAAGPTVAQQSFV